VNGTPAEFTDPLTAQVTALAPLGLAYLNIAHQGDEELLAAFRRLWPGALLLNRAGADIGRRARDIDEGIGDVITVGRLVLANPDLVERVRAGAPLNEPDPATFYSGGERGYTDYPALTPRT
jgi:N-ethylmaleimide reductase